MVSEDGELIFKVMSYPFFWKLKAEELKFAAEILWPHAIGRLNEISKPIEGNSFSDKQNIEPDTFFVFLSLLGYSTEVLFKGIIIKNNPSFVSNGILSKKLKTHDLIKLSILANISLTHQEKIFCGQAYQAMMVESKYPIPNDFVETLYPPSIGGHCKEVFTGLYNRLYPTL